MIYYLNPTILPGTMLALYIVGDTVRIGTLRQIRVAVRRLRALGYRRHLGSPFSLEAIRRESRKCPNCGNRHASTSYGCVDA